ncbi:MAG: amidase family protein [Erysipelotrichaceae bacterium]
MDYKKIVDQLKIENEKLNAMASFVDYEKQVENLANLTCDKNNYFYGLPVVIKDNINMIGTKTTASSKILENYISVYDATVVKRILNNGGIIVGKTAMDELAMGGSGKLACTGIVHNPYSLDHISGGSSGGSAAVVGSKVISFSLGSDTGDSIRKPASYCGCVGVKPTYGLISRYGVLPYASSLDHVGYFVDNVLDASLALPLLVGRDDKDLTSLDVEPKKYDLNLDTKPLKIAVLNNVLETINNNDIVSTFNDVAKELSTKVTSVDYLDLDADLLRVILPTYYMISNCEASANLSNLDGINFGMAKEGKDVEEIMINSRTLGLGSNVRKRLVIGSYGLHEENQERYFLKAQKVRRLICEMFDQVFAQYDLIIAPASNTAPLIEGQDVDFDSDEYLIGDNYLAYANFNGYPSMTIPLGMSNELPYGLNITAYKLNEEKMFAVGKKLEEIINFNSEVK